MLILIHGDHQTKSRQQLQNQINKAKQSGITDIVTLDGKSCSLTQLIQNTESQSLFGQPERLTILENLYRRRSKTELKQFIDSISQLKSTDTALILWDDHQLSLTQTKALTQFTKIVSPLPKIIFRLTESLTPNANLPQLLNLFQKTCDSDSAELVLIMLARQLRLHLQKKSRSFSTSFNPSQLTAMHHQLAEIDYRNKTGQLSLDLKSELANWVVKLYSN